MSDALRQISQINEVLLKKNIFPMVFAEATSVLPLIVSDAYHRKFWENRERKNFSNLFG